MKSLFPLLAERARSILPVFKAGGNSSTAWHSEDYEVAPALPIATDDFWDPATTDCDAAPPVVPDQKRENAPGWTDGWDDWSVSPQISSADDRALEYGTEWFDQAPLPEFDPFASTNIFAPRPQPTVAETIAGRRARWLTSLLDIPEARRRREFVQRFEELFDEFRSPNTFRALAALALEGASAESICDAYEFRKFWMGHPQYWSFRVPRSPIVHISGYQGGSLSWTRCVRLLESWQGIPAERLISPDWYDEWLELGPADFLHWRFADFVEAKLFGDTVYLDYTPAYTVAPGMRADLQMDGFAMLENPSRTGMLLRTETDGWVRTKEGLAAGGLSATEVRN